MRADGASRSLARRCDTDISLTLSAIFVVLLAGYVAGQANPQTQPSEPTPAAVPTGIEVPQALELKSNSAAKTESAPAHQFFWTAEFDSASPGTPRSSPAVRLGNQSPQWIIRQGLAYESTAGSATVAVVGHRGYKLPLYMSAPMETGGLTVPTSAFADPLRLEIQWELTAGVSKVLKRTAGGQTIGVSGEVFIPLNDVSRAAGSSVTSILQSKALRVGLSVGF
jgi:hypothetical protein